MMEVLDDRIWPYVGAKLLEPLGRGVGYLDLWFERRFGHCLSGRMNKLEIQTLSRATRKIEIKSEPIFIAPLRLQRCDLSQNAEVATHNATHNRADLHVLTRICAAVRYLQVV